VLQHPSLYQPVSGLVEQVSKSPPRTLNEGSMDANKDFSRLTRWVSVMRINWGAQDYVYVTK